MMEVREPSLLIWMLMGGVASVILFILTYPSLLCVWHLGYAVMDILAILVVLIGWLDDLTEASSDWEPDSSPSSTGQWTCIALACLFVASLFLGVFLGKIMPCFDVPMKLYPLETSASLLPLMINLVGTFFSVVTGEEGMKIVLSSFHKAYEHLGWELPFALHPARLLANGIWAPLHVWKGGYPLTFGISVFASGMIMDSASAQSGTILTNYFTHALFNSLILIASFLLTVLIIIKW
jgi:hypothetical protein